MKLSDLRKATIRGTKLNPNNIIPVQSSFTYVPTLHFSIIIVLEYAL